MGLFINNENHPAIYKNQAQLTEPNQKIYKQDYLTELITKQDQANAELKNTIQSLEKTLQKQNQLQTNQVKRIRNDVRELAERQNEHVDFGRDVTSIIEAQGKRNEELALKVEQQIEFQRDMVKQLSKQESFQEDFVNRLENQEALMEKLSRKIDDFRSILYERTHFLADKIEEGYNSTSSYIHDLLLNAALPPFQYKLKKKEEKVD